MSKINSVTHFNPQNVYNDVQYINGSKVTVFNIFQPLKRLYIPLILIFVLIMLIVIIVFCYCRVVSLQARFGGVNFTMMTKRVICSSLYCFTFLLLVLVCLGLTVRNLCSRQQHKRSSDHGHRHCNVH